MKYNLVIPMAGEGKRFVDAGYTTPKPFIPVGPVTMIAHAMQGLRPRTGDHLCLRTVWIINAAHRPVAHEYAALFGAHLVTAPGVTQGAACTVLLAAQHFNNDLPLIIANCDQWLETGVIEDFLDQLDTSACDGSMLVFPSDHPKWSYARLDPETMRVVEVAEKIPMSRFATVGVYFFRRGKDFLDAATIMLQRNARSRGEFYVAPVFNELVLDGMDVRVYQIRPDQMHGLGTPEDVAAFNQERGYV